MTATLDGKKLPPADQLLPAHLSEENRLHFTTRGKGTKLGYDEDEVDEVLDLAADRIAGLMRDLEQARRDAGELRAARDQRAVPTGGPLTPAEHEVLDLLARAWIVLCTEIVADGSAKAGDITELVAPFHTIQNAVLAQAGGRSYPDMYRVLGLSLAEWVEAQP